MSRAIHVNLFLKSEQLSPAPVRMRVLAPIAAGFVAGSFLVGAVVARAILNMAHSGELALSIEKERLAGPYEELLRVERRATSVAAGLRQLGYLRDARIPWGRALELLPNHIPETVQLRDLRYAHPALPQAMSTTPLPAPTNRVEESRLTLSGRTADSESVEAMLKALRSETFAPWFERVDIPPGAFRSDDRRTGSGTAALLFELRAVCHPRRFE